MFLIKVRSYKQCVIDAWLFAPGDLLFNVQSVLFVMLFASPQINCKKNSHKHIFMAQLITLRIHVTNQKLFVKIEYTYIG